MHDVSGVAGAAPIWRDVMLHLHRHAPAASPVRPADLQARDIRFESAIEPPRTELFLAGTGQSVIRLAVTHIAARITTPANGAIIALDPDIPPRNQRVPLVASGAGGARWELDGKLLGNVGSVSGWFPQPGRHVLGLKGARGEVLDEARFEVRGAVVRSERGRQACPRDRQAPGTAGIPDCLPARAP
jgi:penicillin-binding protein 1C